MKKIKKLSLKKEVIAALSNEVMANVKGGQSYVACSGNNCGASGPRFCQYGCCESLYCC